MRITKLFKSNDKFSRHEGEAYTDDGKVWRWVSNNAVITVKTCQEHDIPCDVVAQEKAYQEHLDKVLGDYRRNQPAVPSAEEQFEMRAAFGEGADVVDVISGRRWRT